MVLLKWKSNRVFEVQWFLRFGGSNLRKKVEPRASVFVKLGSGLFDFNGFYLCFLLFRIRQLGMDGTHNPLI